MPRPWAVEVHAQSYSNERETPWDKPMASNRLLLGVLISGERETPRGKPVASLLTSKDKLITRSVVP